jgi:hypothetical protein
VFVDDGTAVEVTVSGSGTRFDAAIASVPSISYKRAR